MRGDDSFIIAMGSFKDERLEVSMLAEKFDLVHFVAAMLVNAVKSNHAVPPDERSIHYEKILVRLKKLITELNEETFDPRELGDQPNDPFAPLEGLHSKKDL